MQLFDCWDPIAGQVVKQKYPQTRAEAVKLGLDKYWPGTPCPHHPTEQYLHYVKSGKAACCVLREAVNDFNRAAAAGEPLSAGDASARGLDYYWDPTPNPCGHTGKYTLKGFCYECKQARAASPRQLALKAGETWYLPAEDDVCPTCHTHARRRVASGSCEECENRRRKTTATPFHKDPKNAEIILTRDAAKSMGLEVYRTGKSCRHGHTGFRYVSTSACLTCMGR